MICLGKSYWNAQKDEVENKENIDNNIIRGRNNEKNICKPLQLLKKVSDQPTNCSSEPDTDSFGDDLKKVYSEQIAHDYSYDILGYLKHTDPRLDNFLECHSISKSLRAKMVDWMI